jgi:pimeloyl-ACP methyl ester carboxylesterase
VTAPTATTLSAQNAIWAKDRSFETSDGATIAYTVLGAEGRGTPVVLMNGWMCPDAYWKGIAPAVVEAGHPVVLFDTRGLGQSSLPTTPGWTASRIASADVSVERIAADVIELLDDAGIERAVLGGHSMGVQGIFEAYRLGGAARIAGILPIAGTYENPIPTFMSQPVLERLFPLGRAILGNLPFAVLKPVIGVTTKLPTSWTFALVRTLLRTSPDVTFADIERHVAQITDVDFNVMWRVMEGMHDHSAADVLPTIEVPVLILGGERDHFTPPIVQDRMHALIPNSELVMFPDGGHLLPVEEADGVADAIIAFLRRVDSAA